MHGLRRCARTHKKSFVLHLTVRLGEQQIPQNRNTAVVGLHFDQLCFLPTDLAECVSAAEDFLRPQGGPSTQAFTHFGGDMLYCPVTEVPLIRGIPTGPTVFLAMPGVCVLRPCARAPLKTALYHICPVSETEEKYHSIVIP